MMTVTFTGAGSFFLFTSLVFLAGHWCGIREERNKHLPKGSGGGAIPPVLTPAGSVPPILSKP